MTTAEKRAIDEEIVRTYSRIRWNEAFAAVHGLTDSKTRRLVFDPGIPNSLLQNIYETELKITKEGKIIQEKYVENASGYEENINARIDQPSMNFGSRSSVITQEQSMNQLLNYGSPRQKEKESQSLNQQYPSEQQEDLGQTSMFQDQPPEITKDILKSENLNTVYDIGALDRGRPPINDIYSRNTFETHKTSYKFDAFGNPQAYMKIATPIRSKKLTKLKKNYIPKSQLIAMSTAQEKLVQNLSEKPEKKKVKK
ncbi:MAG: hypothetical protein EZS28_006400 [Streblomastix strix]|uniref:Uncharacterized protein n=1 Tax=Streblomastix strix TaxID=222440 RepID=A0A5J4WU23_9EUKA|nr:MAG: hypothetical protein EZS28_006400 [Streblomastix strix]